jgi:hypothetical protein
MRFLSLLSLISLVTVVAAAPGKQSKQNPRQTRRLTNPQPEAHLNFKLPAKSVLKPYHPSKKEFDDVKAKIQSQAKAQSKGKKLKTNASNASNP